MRLIVHKKSIRKLKGKIRRLTNKNWSISMDVRLLKLRQLATGWIQYFKLADMKNLTKRISMWTRRRLRAVRWKEWKKAIGKYRNLIKLGIDKQKAYEWSQSRKKYWRISMSFVLTKTLTNQYWLSQGYLCFSTYYNNVKYSI